MNITVHTYNPATEKVVPKDAVVLDMGPGVLGWTSIDYLVQALHADGFHMLADQIEAQTKPPRIPEPSLYGVVSSEDDRGLTTYFWHSHGGWHGENGSLVEWDDLVDPVLVRDGIEGAS